KNRRDFVRRRHALSKTKRARSDKLGMTNNKTPLASGCLKRETNDEGGADVRGAIDFDRAVMVLDNFLGDVKAETGAALSLFGGEVRLEDFLHLRGRDAGAVVFHHKIDIKIFAGASDGNGAVFVRTRLDCVNDHVLHGAFDLKRIAKEGAGIVANVRFQTNAALLGHGVRAADDIADD